MTNHRRKWELRKGITSLSLAISTAFACLVISSPVTSQSGNPKDIMIIVNRSSAIDKIQLHFLRDLFLKVRKNWSNGRKAVAINNSNRHLRNDFRMRVLKMDESDENRYWQEHKIRTGETEPLTLNNTLKAVFKLQESISYVYRKDYINRVVKVVMVIPAVEQ